MQLRNSASPGQITLLEGAAAALERASRDPGPGRRRPLKATAALPLLQRSLHIAQVGRGRRLSGIRARTAVIGFRHFPLAEGLLGDARG